MNEKNVLRRLQAATRRKDELAPSDFETAANSMGQDSPVAEFVADTAVAFRDGRIKFALPAYDSFQTAGDGSTQTFGLSASIAESPDTQDAVVWFGGDYQGVPAIDYTTDEVTVDGPGTVETVHVFYLSSDPATVTLRKVTSDGDNREQLAEFNAALVHQTNQNEQPERLRLGSGLRRFVASDMTAEVVVNAPYVVRFEDPDGDGAIATNALLAFRVTRSDRSIDGLPAVVESRM